MSVLADYVVLKTLSVKNVRVEPRKVRAEYAVEHFSGSSESFELIYSYEQPIFNANEAADINLGCMMAAQVALNYGLFCQVIEFDGLFDRVDQEFLVDMMENTSVEILTNKLLIDNEFILPAYKPLEIEKQKKYTRAELRFVNTGYGERTLFKKNDTTDQSKYAILSSGGKDSLLTYGIIREIGEPYPVFINESGRHWFTAVNSYNTFRTAEPNTHKPWCNSDRLFNWMLRQLPFIRKDYASVRADIYPIRLWTVAVFLFGVLPIARKKGIGNILIGNEYDTTVRGKAGGISHYCGLYDQSRNFDSYLTRYYEKKGWSIRQYSILRPLSELLIMKILTQRYPELQRDQVSCHAAHKVGERMHPCGRCEKCRRIIGMLMALGGDPRRCGYSDDQIERCLGELGRKSVKQIGSDAAHLYYLLLEKGLVEKNSHTQKLARRHDEIARLRFDRLRSDLADLPESIREKVFGLFLQYADGAVVLRERRWQHIDLGGELFSPKTYRMD